MVTDFKPHHIPYLEEIDRESYKFPWWENSWADLGDLKVRVLENNTLERHSFGVIGFSSYQVITVNNKAIALHIHKLCVAKQYRNKGHGSTLHRDLLRVAQQQKIKQLFMVVHEENNNIPWLQSWGWNAVSVRSNLYPDGRDGYVFERGVYL
jgi:ribosomal protein S18 acetylase RimI-like enzyme